MQEPQFAIKRIFLKDLSFESPLGVAAFTPSGKPEMNVDLSSRNQRLDDENVQVDLRVTVTAKMEQDTAFIVEVEYSGIFVCKNIAAQELKRILGTVCLNILFPYVRETLDTTINKANFPPLLLAPINFEALYQDAQEIESATASH